MAKPTRPKNKRRSTAAYSASQPLFDTLRTATDRVEEQRSHLEVARDTVQRLHVKLPPNSLGDATTESHELYMDGAVRAWRAAAESYGAIFEALARVTAEDTSTGRLEREGHDAFVQMAETARHALEILMDWEIPAARLQKLSARVAARRRQVGSSNEVTEDGGRSQSDGDDTEESSEAPKVEVEDAKISNGGKEPVDNKPANPILLSLLSKKRPSPEAEEQHEEQGPPAKASKLSEESQGSAKSSKRALKRQRRSEKRAAKRAEEVKIEEMATAPGVVDGDKPQNGIKYEDVSAEVAARLKAKEEKNAKKAEEKKRKRESGESLPGAAVNGKAEKPKKKKAKSNEGEPVAEDVAKEKARKHRRETEGGEEGVQGGGRKKRKKVES